jgi:hypothetical protein
MGRLSKEEIDEVEILCRKINCSGISNAEKRQAYKKLERIFDKYFVELPTQSNEIKGL